MPYKYAKDKGWKVPKQKYKLKNWSKYSNALKDRGRIDFWLDKEAIDNWGFVSLLPLLPYFQNLGATIALRHT